MNTTNAPESLAWAWVLQHANLIQGISRSHTQGTGLSHDDHHGDLLVRLVEKWESYDPDRSSASTWVWFQSMAVRKSMTHRRSKGLREVTMEDHHHPTVGQNQDSRIMVLQARSIATGAEWTAAVAMASGHTGKSLGEVCGCAPFSAQRRVLRLRNRLA